MKIIREIQSMQRLMDQLRAEGKQIGFVPTMGFLHQGHLSLMRLAKQQCDFLVVSIFVNPTQFGPNEDLSDYPRDFERDEALCREEKVDIIFYPSEKEIYPTPYLSYINVNEITDYLCGVSRPGHFRGVATIVGKLFNIVKPHLAVFGQKDYQQAVVIRQMVKDLNFDVKIVVGPIVREPDGLAMSSRNKYLSPSERKDALVLQRAIRYAKQMIQDGERQTATILRQMEHMVSEISSARTDYISISDPITLKPVDQIYSDVLVALAVFIGKTRLIDNEIISPPDKHRGN